jgi:2-phospho-L-lactate guanylyltransferase
MPTLIVPFRGAAGKSRLGLPTEAARAAISRAMVADVVAACVAVGPTYVVTPDDVTLANATVVLDPGGGQGAAVGSGLDAASATGEATLFLVVNADLPCVTPRDLLALAGAVPDHGIALAAAADGTTNALAFASPNLFAPLYGAGSAARFAERATTRVVDVPNLIDDVDTVADLERLQSRLGPHTRKALTALRTGAAA